MQRYRLVRQGSDGRGWWSCIVGAAWVSLLAVSFGASTARGQAPAWINFVEDPSRIVSNETNDAPCNPSCTGACSAGNLCACACEKDMAVGDLDGDLVEDLVIVRKQPMYLSGGASNLLLLNVNGTMVDRSDLVQGFADLTEDRDVVIIDVNRDPASNMNMPDVVTAATFEDPPRVYINLGCCNTACSPSNPCALENQMPCSFPGATWCGLKYDPTENRILPFDPTPNFCGVGAGDVNGDGCVDLYFVDYGALEDRLLVNTTDANGACTGVFEDKTDELICQFATGSCFNVSNFGTAAQIIDINGDECNDIVKSNSTGSSGLVNVIYNTKVGADCTGQFVTQENLAGGDLYMFAAEDINNTGNSDIYLVRDSQDSYRINQGGGNFSTDTPVTNSPKTEGQGGNVRLIDLDGDSFRDVVVSDVDVVIPSCTRKLAILQTEVDPLNSLNVTVSDPFDAVDCPWNTNGTYDTAVLDIDGDLKPDLWSGTCDGNHLFLQTAIFDDCNSNAIPDACEGGFGACCLPNGTCREMFEPCCDQQGGLHAEQFNCSGGNGPPFVFCAP